MAMRDARPTVKTEADVVGRSQVSGLETETMTMRSLARAQLSDRQMASKPLRSPKPGPPTGQGQQPASDRPRQEPSRIGYHMGFIQGVWRSDLVLGHLEPVVRRSISEVGGSAESDL